MEESISDSSTWSKREIEVAEILVQFHHVWSPFNWGRKRKRSAIQDTPSLKYFQTAWHYNGGADGGAVVASSFCDGKSQTVVKRRSSSPASPLLFLPSESDEKPKDSGRKPSLKKKKEDIAKKRGDLTQNKASLNQEMENVERHHNELKDWNLKLKARKQELSSGPKCECKNPNMEIAQPLRLVHANDSVNFSNSTAENELQKQQAMQMQIASIVPEVIPDLNETYLFDLNASPKEFIHVDFCQPLNVADNKTVAARMRQRRLKICRLKKPIGNSKSQLSIRPL